MEFRAPDRASRRLRMWLSGPSASGKTTTALRVARGLCEYGRQDPTTSIGVIDTEDGRAALELGVQYGDGKPMAFQHLQMPDTKPETFLQALQVAAKSNLHVVIVDSMSHEWMGILAKKDSLPDKQQFSAWKDLTPLHDRIIQAVQRMPCHVIVTFRSKLAYAIEEVDEGGRKKTRPVKLGMQPVAREGTEYEFDVALELDERSRAAHWKRPRGLFRSLDGQTWDHPGEQLGRELAACLAGVPRKEDGPTRQPGEDDDADDMAALRRAWKHEQEQRAHYGLPPMDKAAGPEEAWERIRQSREECSRKGSLGS